MRFRMLAYPASVYLQIAEIAGIAAALFLVCSRELRSDVRFWLCVAVVASSLYATV